MRSRGNRFTGGELFEVKLIRPPNSGACPDTGIIAAPRPATADELERVRWHERTMTGNPVEVVRPHGAEVRERYGVRREFDPIAYWAGKAEARTT